MVRRNAVTVRSHHAVAGSFFALAREHPICCVRSGCASHEVAQIIPALLTLRFDLRDLRHLSFNAATASCVAAVRYPISNRPPEGEGRRGRFSRLARMGKHRTGGDRSRQVRDVELRTDLIRVTRRLTRHLDSHVSGEPTAIDDVASVLRILCGHGTGNDLITRAIRRLGATDPLISVGLPPEPVKGTFMSFGSMPEVRFDNGNRLSTYSRWLHEVAVVHTEHDGRTTRLQWAKLIYEIANTRGAHATESIAPWVDESHLLGVSDLGLTDYLIERVAVVVEDRLRMMLTEIGEADSAPAIRRLPLHPANIQWLRLTPRGGVIDIEMVAGSHEGTPEGDYPLLRLTQAGLRFGANLGHRLGMDYVTLAPVEKVVD